MFLLTECLVVILEQQPIVFTIICRQGDGERSRGGGCSPKFKVTQGTQSIVIVAQYYELEEC